MKNRLLVSNMEMAKEVGPQVQVVRCWDCGISLQKFIHQGWNHFERVVTFQVGSGIHVSFWHDKWCADIPLKDSYPDLYPLSSNRYGLVAEYTSGEVVS